MIYMYRDASVSLEETIARLEAEVRELRAIGGKRRERRLVAMAVVGMMIAIHAVMGCLATRIQAERARRDASMRLGERTSDLMACVQLLDERTGDVEACRAQMEACSAAEPAPARSVDVKAETAAAAQ